MSRHRRNGRGTDSLVAESERLRRELLKTASRLEVFSDELMSEARQLREEAADAQDLEGRTDERGNEHTGEPGTPRKPGQGSPAGGPVDPNGDRADG